MTSMAEHLPQQEYLRLRHSPDSLMAEPRLSDEDAARLLDAYERNDTSAAEYLDLVTENRPFSPTSTTHVVVIDSGPYCSSIAMPVVFKSFLQDHGNPVVEETLSRHEVALVEKAPSGGVLIHVRSSEAEQKLVDREVMLLGRRFKIKRQSPFLNKFFLDIFGIRSTSIANDLFIYLSALGARPLFMTPRDVNLEAQVATPTWRFYFGQDQAPACLKVRGFVTIQLIHGKNFFTVRGKRSLAPPERAVGFKKSTFGVVLPSNDGCDAQNPTGPMEGTSDRMPPTRMKTKPSHKGQPVQAAKVPQTPLKESDAVMTGESDRSPPQQPTGPRHANAGQRMQNDDSAEGPLIEWLDQTARASDVDVDMTRQLESGFKRPDPSFVDQNPYGALADLECSFETFEPEFEEYRTPGVLIVPRLVENEATTQAREPLPTKRRTNLNAVKPSSCPQIDDELLLSAEATSLETNEDRIAQNEQHLDHVTSLLNESKNMDL